jgi:hypothetical protein
VRQTSEPDHTPNDAEMVAGARIIYPGGELDLGRGTGFVALGRADVPATDERLLPPSLTGLHEAGSQGGSRDVQAAPLGERNFHQV